MESVVANALKALDLCDNRPDDPLSATEVCPQAIIEGVTRLEGKAGPYLSAALGKETAEEVIAAVARGIEARDPATMGAVEEIARAMAVGLSHLEQLFDPELTLIGGPVARWGEPMLERLRHYVGKFTEKTLYRDEPARLEFTQLGDDVIALGAAALVMDQLFEHVEINGSR